MKRILIFLLTLMLSLGVCSAAFAEEEETTVDASQPRLMVVQYSVDGGYLSPNNTAKLKITLKNFSQTKALRNIKLSIADESDEIETVGMPSIYVERIYAGSTYEWELNIKAVHTAQIGQHKLTVTSEYEDKYYSAYSSSDIINVDVRQSVAIDYNGIVLPVKVTQGETQSVEIKLMNTGKTNLTNCRVDFDIDGLLSGGTIFIGEIPYGESADSSVNFKVLNDKLGEVKGTAVISYEDAYGENHSEAIDLATIIEKKIDKVQSEKADEQTKYPLWWVFLLVGLIIGGAVGFIILTAIHSSKQRKQDELRL